MYGMVNKAVRGLVLDAFGEDAWARIHSNAEAPADFVAFEQYDDAVTYNLVGAAVEELQMSAEDVLKAFGNYWVAEIAMIAYADIMNQTGTSFVAFLKNLDHMHSRIQVTFPGYSPPSFRVKETGPGEVLLDYYSKREGLLPFVEGLLAGLATHFQQEITIEQLPDDSHSMPCKRMKVSFKAATAE